MAENGILDYQGMNQAIYRGATSNIVVDTQSMSIEIGAGNTIHTSNLHFECNHDANVASVQLNSNVVTEFSRSKKLIKYPRVALSANSDSGYVASASSYYNTGVQPYQAFDVVNGGLGWESGPNSQNGNGRYSSGSTFNTTYLNDNPTLGEGGFQTTAGSTTYTGEWVQIQLPVSIQSTTHVFGNSDANSDWNLRIPQSGVILGSTNGSSWELIHSFDDTIKNATITVSHTKYYSYFRLVVLSVGTNQTLANVPEWEIFGTPEYDPEAAGVDIKMTSYPNVPNTDWLEVYYDAKESSSYPGTGGTVLDLSGNQINGTLNGGVGFDSEYKAFTFDEADDYITLDTGKTGNYVFSVSLWFKSSGNSIETLFHMNGDYATNNTVWLYGSGTNLYISFINNSYTCDTGKEIADNMWHHTSFVYNGNGESGRDIYLDGVRLSGSVSGSSAGSDLNLTSTSSISRIGALNYTSGIIHKFKGSIANFRLFNRALTSDEVWQLYAYQKEYFGHGDLSMTLKAGRLGIGTSEPKVALDVRGGIAGPFTTFLTGDVTTSIVTAAASTSIIYPVTSYTFDVPSEYHAFGTKNLEIYGQIKWCGEIDNPWNAMFSARLYYGSGLTSYVNSAENTTSNANTRNNGAGVPSTNATNDDFISTLEACILSSRFYIPNCPVSNGSQLKLELRFRQGNASSSVYTNRTKNDLTNDVNYERGTTNFFLAVK